MNRNVSDTIQCLLIFTLPILVSMFCVLLWFDTMSPPVSLARPNAVHELLFRLDVDRDAERQSQLLYKRKELKRDQTPHISVSVAVEGLKQSRRRTAALTALLKDKVKLYIIIVRTVALPN